jgi:hypothetical protein
MSGKKKPLDLETAQRLYIAAGSPEHAEAAGFVIDAVRNTVQGEWGTSFVSSLEGLLVKYIHPLNEQIDGLRTDVQQSAAETSTRLGKHDQDIDALQTTVAEHGTKLGLLHWDHEERITSLEDYRDEMQAMRDALAELSARIGGALPTEADQELSAELRADAAERGDHGDIR